MTTKLRPEVSQALYRVGPVWDAIVRWGDSRVLANVEAVERQLLALVELGVRLGVSRCADALMICGKKSDNAILAAMCWGLAAEFRAAKPADILQAQPGDKENDAC